MSTEKLTLIPSVVVANGVFFSHNHRNIYAFFKKLFCFAVKGDFDFVLLFAVRVDIDMCHYSLNVRNTPSGSLAFDEFFGQLYVGNFSEAGLFTDASVRLEQVPAYNK